jgi:hypothetical protein
MMNIFCLSIYIGFKVFLTEHLTSTYNLIWLQSRVNKEMNFSLNSNGLISWRYTLLSLLYYMIRRNKNVLQRWTRQTNGWIYSSILRESWMLIWLKFNEQIWQTLVYKKVFLNRRNSSPLLPACLHCPLVKCGNICWNFRRLTSKEFRILLTIYFKNWDANSDGRRCG